MTTDPLDVTAAMAATTTERSALVAGAQLGKYKLERVLGTGGMGVVWAAHDPDLERSVAIKLLQAAEASPEQRARLLREARAMARLKHPNVLTVYEVDSHGERDFIAMELVEGSSLDGWLAMSPPADEIFRAVIAAGRGLAAAHAAGLVHRDFKPHNILRSRDGRVLVTDFGLARGLGAEVEVAPIDPDVPIELDLTVDASNVKSSSQSGRKSDPLLDGTLTRPGAMMGTPAYMSPEQFLGALPDPRTDQFAYCVTAWQALAGERPFSGTNIDELRRAASAGVAGVAAQLPRAIRAVLERGLDPDPAARWPDLDTLLDALERAKQAPRRTRIAVLAVFGAAATVALIVPMQHRGPGAPSEKRCEPTFEAWTAERRAAFEKRLDRHPNVIAVADAFDAFRTSWQRRYREACAAGSGAKATARLNCLVGERDDFDGIARLTDTIPKTRIAFVDLWGLLPSLEACDGDSPVAPPLLPEDRKVRDHIVALRSELRAMDADKLLAQEATLVQAATKIGWKPLLAEVGIAIGSAAQTNADWDKARDRFETAAELALRLADFRVEATARIGLLEVELDGASDPSNVHRIDKLIADATDAVQRAGNDPALANSVADLRARYEIVVGQLGPAIDRYEAARKQLLAAHAYRAAAVATSQELRALQQRHAPTDLDTGWKLGHDTLEVIDAANHVFAQRLLADAVVGVAWRRGDLDQVHALHDRFDHRAHEDHPIRQTGRVIGPDGKAVPGARVIAWHDRLEGDATRLGISPAWSGAVATTDATGAFSIETSARQLIAEHGTLRSAPLEVSGDGVQLVLAPTRTFRGTVAAVPPVELDIVAHSTHGGNELEIRSPVSPDGTFTLAGVPPVAATFRVEGNGLVHAAKVIDGGPVRDGATLAWPDGPALDVIVRVAKASGVYVLRGHTIPKTPQELAFRMAHESDVVEADDQPVGLANTTPEGIAVYTKGDRHAVIRDNAQGDVTVCTRIDADVPPVCVVKTIVLVALARPVTWPAVVVVLPAPR